MASSPPSPTTSDGKHRRPLARVLRPWIAVSVAGCLLSVLDNPLPPRAVRQARSAGAAVTATLSGRGFLSAPEDIHWVDAPSVSRGLLFGTHRFVALLRRAGEPSDVWLGHARLSPEGQLLAVSSLHNVSDTSAVAEANLFVSGDRLAWCVQSESEVVAVQIADLSGQMIPSGDFTWLERLQTRITFFQETGQWEGIRRRAYRFRSSPKDVVLAWTSSGLRVDTSAGTGLLSWGSDSLDALGLVPEPAELGSPGDFVTWAVDRARALSWFGTDRMQWVKAVAFGAWERLDAVKRRVVKSNPSAVLDDEVGDFLSHAAAPASDPISGWPPRSMVPILAPALPDEGVYRTLDDDPFAVPPEGGPSPFAFGYVRPDATRTESRIFVTVWDPRRVELHTMTGTREPKTATGETGAGTVPRDPATIGRLAGAFNGGFQATHGEFGMMAQSVVYLPPKPYAATIAELSDGTVGFGTWPNDEAIPDGMLGFRQNLTPLVSDGVVNPYARTWWGGVPPGWEDATRTVRTGLCLTEEQFAAYFYGSTISADHLAKAMVAAHCRYGVHLDMNPGHTGFEFYRVGLASSLPKLQRKLDANWETRGDVPGAQGFAFLGRRMLRTMHLMHFPRYVRTDSRDFFYLTHRNVLPPAPGERLRSTNTTASDNWQTKEHLQHGFPPAIASTRLRPDADRPDWEVAVVVLDAKWAAACRGNCPGEAVIASVARTPRDGGVSVYQRERHFAITEGRPPSDAVLVAVGKDETHTSKVAAALGVAHRDWLYYVEVTRGGDRLRDAKTLKKLLGDLGCSAHVFLEHPLELSLATQKRAASSHRDELTWIRDDQPMAKRLFPETPAVAPSVWQPLQNKRVRYIRNQTRTRVDRQESDTPQPRNDDATTEPPASSSAGEEVAPAQP